MSSVGELVSKAQAFAAAIASAPSVTDTPFVKNARPFVLWAGMPGLIAIGLLATYMKLDVLAGSAVVTIGAVMRELARFRSQDNQVATTAATENTKTITAALEMRWLSYPTTGPHGLRPSRLIPLAPDTSRCKDFRVQDAGPRTLFPLLAA